jgi:hypothetical protein
MKRKTKRVIKLGLFFLFIVLLIIKVIPFLFGLIMESWAKGYPRH